MTQQRLKIVSIFLMLLMVLSDFMGAIGIVHANELATDVYYGTARNTTAVLLNKDGQAARLMDVLYLNYPNHPEWNRVAYCINMSKEFPKVHENIQYNSYTYDTEENPFYDFDNVGRRFDRPRMGQYTAVRNVRNILYRGFPLNGAGIQEKYHLTDDEFWHLTQMAIHFWTDTAYDQKSHVFSVAYTDYYNLRQNRQDLIKAYEELIAEQGVSAPADLMLNLYAPVNVSGYQHMLSADYQQRNIEFLKTDKENKPLSGAKFKIERVSKINDKLFAIDREYDTYEFVTGDDGKVDKINQGESLVEKSIAMIAGEYTLTETKTPKGYTSLESPVKFKINQRGEVTLLDDTLRDYIKITLKYNHPTAKNKITGAEIQVINSQEKAYVNPTGKLRTTVEANGQASSAEKAVEVTPSAVESGVQVVDTIHYDGLVAGTTYAVTGELYEVQDGKTVGEAKAKKTQDFVAEQVKGDWKLDFGKVAGLEAGKTYVVYESAVSKTNLIDSNKDNKADKPQELSHKDPTDKAQTVVIEKAVKPLISVPVKKVWSVPEGTVTPESVTIVLEQTGQEVVLNATNNWSGEFGNLPKADAQGNIISYTIQERPVEGYRSEILGNMSSGYVVTNTKLPEIPQTPENPPTPKENEQTIEKISVHLEKRWEGKKADSATFYLLANGEKVDEITLTEASGWAYSFENLDKTLNGEVIRYTVEEAKLDGYRSYIEGNMLDGFVITNTEEKKSNPSPKSPKKKVDLPATSDSSSIGFTLAGLFFGSMSIMLAYFSRKQD
ncbi:TPA: Cna B-type domain-containing protein [Streptococcus equi subsp. zooepidemicus]|nr:Cna B-type domain-containing protein [Streptococcus equi subsp. zooepidemicus]